MKWVFAKWHHYKTCSFCYVTELSMVVRLFSLAGIRKDERTVIIIILFKVMRYENISNCFDAFGESRHCTYLSIVYLPTFFVDEWKHYASWAICCIITLQRRVAIIWGWYIMVYVNYDLFNVWCLQYQTLSIHRSSLYFNVIHTICFPYKMRPFGAFQFPSWLSRPGSSIEA